MFGFLSKKGAGVGMLTAFGLMMWLGLSAQIAKSSGIVSNSQMKPFSIENCSAYDRTINSSSHFTNSTTDYEYI